MSLRGNTAGDRRLGQTCKSVTTKCYTTQLNVTTHPTNEINKINKTNKSNQNK